MKSFLTITNFKLGQKGFTLTELVIIIVTLGILAAVAIPKFSDMAESSKVSATKQELAALKRAIIGNPQAVSGGKYVDRGFEGDVGAPPNSLNDLATKPDTISAYNKFTSLGWNGPYIDDDENSYLTDAWGSAYIYQRSTRTILSVGGSDTLSVSF